jgi:hypothetical protein
MKAHWENLDFQFGKDVSSFSAALDELIPKRTAQCDST